MRNRASSYLNIFRLIFIVFSLYLMGDVFSRWDGVKYYASFREFLPSVSLIAVLLTILAALLAFSIWLTARLFQTVRINIKAEQIFICLSYMTALALGLYIGKAIFKNIHMDSYMKSTLLAAISVVSLLLTWFTRKISGSWMESINERISPLVWVFGTFIIFSIPFITYHTWMKSLDEREKTIVNDPGFLNTKRPNILLITFDAMTALDMSAYGYHRPTTPFIKKWSKNTSLFSRVEAESNYTTPTTASLMTGKRVWSHQTYFVEVASEIVGNNNENLPFLLKKNGYSNMALQQIHRASVKKLGVAESFDIVLGPDKFSYSTNIYKHIDTLLYSVFGEKIILYDWILKKDFILFKLLNRLLGDASVTTQPPENAFNKALEILDDDFPEPFFAWIHIFAPHDPYLPPEPFKGAFDPSLELRTWKSQMHSNPMRMIDKYRARYDEFILYADKQFESFMAEFEKRQSYGNTLIILSADHGESFEHNYKGHGGPHLFEQLTHIPLIIKEPGQTRGRTIDHLAEQVDIPPTILALAGIPVPQWMEGRSLVPTLRGESLSPKTAFSMNLESNPGIDTRIKSGTIAAWEGGYKLIHYLDNESSLLFNLTEDPHELYNLFNEKPETGRRLIKKIKNNLEKANRRITAAQ